MSELTSEPWKYEVDSAGRLKCLCCCASVTGSCGRPGHDNPGLAARARAEFLNRPPPPKINPQDTVPQIADGYGRLAGPREWGGQPSHQNEAHFSMSPRHNHGTRIGAMNYAGNRGHAGTFIG